LHKCAWQEHVQPEIVQIGIELDWLVVEQVAWAL
jgi:hypothetical protein